MTQELTKNLEIWERVICEDYPDISRAKMVELYWQSAADYSFAYGNPRSMLYEQFVIMKTLTNPKKDDNET